MTALATSPILNFANYIADLVTQAPQNSATYFVEPDPISTAKRLNI